MLKNIHIHWEGYGDVDIGYLQNADKKVVPFKVVNLILSNGRKGLIHNGKFIQHKVDDVSLYISYGI